MTQGFHEQCVEMFKRIGEPTLSRHYALKYVDGEDAQLGALRGVQLESPAKGGYLYFWSTGHVGFQLMDYATETEIIEDALVEADTTKAAEILDAMLAKL